MSTAEYLLPDEIAGAPEGVVPAEAPNRREFFAGPIVAALMVPAALLCTNAAGISFRDPDHVVGKRLALVACFCVLLVVVDVLVRAGARTRTWRPSRAAMRAVRMERWTRSRGAAVACALVGFYLSYLAYRNLKSVVPLLEPGVSYDRQLTDVDKVLFLGQHPAEVLHSLLGSGLSAHVLSGVYVSFIAFLPVSLAVALVFSKDLRGGIFYATALSLNWGVGAASYFLLPAVGPIFHAPQLFAGLDPTEVTRLQGLMLDERADFLRNPQVADATQNIAAFGSLHIAMLLTAVLAAHMLGAPRRLRIALWWLWVVSAVSTIYLGWHYVVDDIAGLAICAISLLVARELTGFAPRGLQWLRLPLPRRAHGVASAP